MSDIPLEVSINSIERLTLTTTKQTVDEAPTLVTKFSFQAEPTADQLRTLLALLKDGGPLNVKVWSPQLRMNLEIKQIEEQKAREGEVHGE